MSKSAFGTLLKVKIGATYTTIAKVGDIKGPSISTETIKGTTHDSPDGFHEYIAGLSDGGEVSFSLKFDSADATHAPTADGIAALAVGRAVKEWKVCPPAQMEWSFDGIVTKLETSYPVEGDITAEVSIKVSGKPVLAAAV